MEPAINSLPVPLSPRIRIVASVGPTVRIISRNSFRLWQFPMMSSS